MNFSGGCGTVAGSHCLPDIAAPSVRRRCFTQGATGSRPRDRAGGWADVPLYPSQLTLTGKAVLNRSASNSTGNAANTLPDIPSLALRERQSRAAAQV